MIIVKTKTFNKKEIRNELLKLDRKGIINLSEIESSRQFNCLIDWIYKDNVENLQTYHDLFDPDLIREYIKAAKRRFPL